MSPAAPTSPQDLAAPADDVRRLLSVGEGFLSDATWRNLADAGARLQDARVNVVVLGAFKRGKSTLLNALLEREVLPIGVLPLTSVITEVRHGHVERATIEFGDGRTEDHSLDELALYVTEAANPDNQRGVKAARVHVSHRLLADGLQLLDTPGIASMHAHNTRSAHEALGRVDAAICVLSVDQALADTELELIKGVAALAPKLIVAMNKVDLVGPSDRDDALAFVAAGLRGAGVNVGNGDLVAVSAREGIGVDELRAALADLRGVARDDLVARSVQRTALAAASELERAACVERAALELPLGELERRARELRSRLVALDVARGDAEDVLHRRMARIVKQHVDEPLLSFADDRRAEHDAALDAEVAAQAWRSPRALADHLDGWIDDTVRAQMVTLASDVERVLGAALAELHSRYATVISGLLRDLESAAADLLQTPLPRDPGLLRIRDPSRFSFKLRDPEHALDILVAGARASVPGRLGRRLVVRAARERLHAMVDRHAGRLRSDLSERAVAATNAYAGELADTLERSRIAVEAAVERAQERRRSGMAETQARRRELKEISGEARAIRERVTTERQR